MQIILASGSTRRLEILRQHGVDPVVMPSDVAEVIPSNVQAQGIEAMVIYLAHIKAQAVYEQLGPSDALILAADTVAYKEGIISKPKDEADAFRILSFLRNTSHDVLTGISLINAQTGNEQQFCDLTKVYFKDYPDAEIYRYIREEPPFDKSGSYGIQTSWSANVERIDGDVENVMGLPWHRLRQLIIHSS